MNEGPFSLKGSPKVYHFKMNKMKGVHCCPTLFWGAFLGTMRRFLTTN